MVIREATPDDWPAIWRFMRPIVAAGDGTALGTAEVGPNHGGPGAHVATAGFMGRRLGEHVLQQARADGYRGKLGFEVLTTIPEASRRPAHGDVGLHIMYRPL